MGTVSFYDSETKQGLEAGYTKYEGGVFHCVVFAPYNPYRTVGTNYGDWAREEKLVVDLRDIKIRFAKYAVLPEFVFHRYKDNISNLRWGVSSHKRDTFKTFVTWLCFCKDKPIVQNTRTLCKHCLKHRCKSAPATCWSYGFQRVRTQKQRKEEQKYERIQASLRENEGVPYGVPVPEKPGMGLNKYYPTHPNRYRGTKSIEQRIKMEKEKERKKMDKCRGNKKNKHLSHVLKKDKVEGRNWRNYGGRRKYRDRFERKLARRQRNARVVFEKFSDYILIDQKFPRKLDYSVYPWY